MLRNNAKEFISQIRPLAQNDTVIMYRKGYSPPKISVFVLNARLKIYFNSSSSLKDILAPKF